MTTAPRPAFDVREPAADAALGQLPEWDLSRPLRRPGRAGDRPRPRLARRPRAPAFAARLRGQARRARRRRAARRRSGATSGSRPSSGRIMCYAGPALLPEHHRRRRAPSSSATARPRSPTAPRRWSSSASSSTGSTTPRLDALLAADADARPLPAGLRAAPGDEALPALRRAGEVPARPVGRRRLGLEQALRRDHGRAGIRGRGGETLPLEATLYAAHRPGPGQARGRRRGAGGGLRARTSSSSPASPTRWPRKRRSRTAGARCRRRRPAGTSPTTSSPRWSRRCATPSSPPIRGSRTAITS